LAGYLNIGWDFTLHAYGRERAPTKQCSAVAWYFFECQIAKTCHRKLKQSQCSQYFRGGGTELASETGNATVQSVAVAKCFFKQENKKNIQEVTLHHGVNK